MYDAFLGVGLVVMIPLALVCLGSLLASFMEWLGK